MSYPAGVQWREEARAAEVLRDYHVSAELQTLLRAGSGSRFLVLIRDPLAAKLSAMRRFDEAALTADWFAMEAKVMVQALSLLAKDVSQLPCERTLFVGYELLAAFPQEHRGVLAAFLGVPADTAALTSFLAQIEPCPICGAIAERWWRTGSLRAEVQNCSTVPPPVDADESFNLGRKLLNAGPLQRLKRHGAPCGSVEQCQEEALRTLVDKLAPLEHEPRAESALMPSTVGFRTCIPGPPANPGPPTESGSG